jgi:sugar/nucleoside kinase (ribokinase family)
MIHVFGTICLDRVLRVPAFPRIGGYVEIEEELLLLGGEAANTANALKAWGAQLILTGNSLGSGVIEEQLVRLMQERGLPLDNLRLGTPGGDAKPPVCDIYVTPDGERTMFGRGFSDMDPAVDPESVPLQPGEWFTAEPNMGRAARAVAARAAEAGMKTYLMDFIRENEPIAEGSFWQASTDWAGSRNDTNTNLDWVRRWSDRYGCFTILTDGANGFVAGSPARPPRHFPAFPAPLIVDTTGGGDLFRAGMLYGLDQGWSVEKCLRTAAASGALACGTLGATTSVPKLSEIEALIAAYPQIAAEYA